GTLLGRRWACTARRGWGGAGAGARAPLGVLSVAQRGGANIPLVSVGWPAPRDRLARHTVRAHTLAAEPPAGAGAVRRRQLARVGGGLTGNYCFFSLLAIVWCLALLADVTLRGVLAPRLAAGEAEPLWWRRVTATLAAVIAPLSALTFAREIGATLPGARGSG